MGSGINVKGVVSAKSCCHPHRCFFQRRPSPPPPPLLFFLPASKFQAPIPSLRMSNSQRAIRHVICLSGTNSADNYAPDDSTSSSKEAAFDIALPRRSLMVQFTCDACGERTRRLINRLAYERGTVFVQCAGCLVYHKFVDNLGLVVEYDLREELHGDSDVAEAGTSNSES
ncbi:uncharacterized protein [Elaeis guineensis]|uniref:Uncharacterized protein LOC105047826 isoform X2 n=1 Tax=Elaeis guineensis var. tenera TaxID=51953 RepID=A0A6I9REH1_ELAGV|nr:uncharacterized protein LOC105047826 isoform X2 [Elaeis guineensis]